MTIFDVCKDENPFEYCKNVFSWYMNIENGKPDIFKKYLSMMYGKRECRYSSETVPDFTFLFLCGKEYEYAKLYATTILDYNPIQNYDMTEHEKNDETTTGKNTTKVISEPIQNSHEENIGASNETISTTTGERVNTKEDISKVAPFDTNDFMNKNSNSNNETIGAGTDKTTSDIKARSNTIIDKLGNTSTTSETENKTTAGSGRTLERSGNIGVTTTQDMIKSERNVATFNFIALVCKDVADFIGAGVYE